MPCNCSPAVESSPFFGGSVKVVACCRLQFCDASGTVLCEINLTNVNIYSTSSGGIGLDDGVSKKTFSENDALALGYVDVVAFRDWIESQRVACCAGLNNEPTVDYEYKQIGNPTCYECPDGTKYQTVLCVKYQDGLEVERLVITLGPDGQEIPALPDCAVLCEMQQLPTDICVLCVHRLTVSLSSYGNRTIESITVGGNELGIFSTPFLVSTYAYDGFTGVRAILHRLRDHFGGDATAGPIGRDGYELVYTSDCEDNTVISTNTFTSESITSETVEKPVVPVKLVCPKFDIPEIPITQCVDGQVCDYTAIANVTISQMTLANIENWNLPNYPYDLTSINSALLTALETDITDYLGYPVTVSGNYGRTTNGITIQGVKDADAPSQFVLANGTTATFSSANCVAGEVVDAIRVVIQDCGTNCNPWVGGGRGDSLPKQEITSFTLINDNCNCSGEIVTSIGNIPFFLGMKEVCVPDVDCPYTITSIELDVDSDCELADLIWYAARKK